jgi:hypothetical protein
MRIGIAALAGLALVATSCGPKKLALPEDPVDKAATCGVVEAAHARHTMNAAKGALPFPEQGRILHYAMLTAVNGHGFDTDKAVAVTKRMPELEPNITGGQYETLVKPCAAAFPETTQMSNISLPKDDFDSRLGCYELGGFLSRALQELNVEFGEQLTSYGELRRRIDDKVAVGLVAHGARAKEAQDKLKDDALAKFTRLGSPMPVMEQCLAKYPAKKV